MNFRVLVFGTFDCIHPGHLYFLEKAKSLGSDLIVAVARDSHVKLLKNKTPIQNEKKRLKDVVALNIANQVVLSDEILGSFAIINQVNPDLIAIGHDQKQLFDSLEKWLFANRPEIQIFHIGYFDSIKHDLHDQT